MFRCCLILALTLASTCAWALVRPTLEQFQTECLKHRGRGPIPLDFKPKIGKTQFLPVRALVATQTRFSYAAVLKKLEKYDALDYHDGTSVLPRKKALKGILYNGLVYIVDGHHRAVISVYSGATTAPVELVADLSEEFQTQEDFDRYLAKTYRSYLHDSWGRMQAPVDLCSMLDDPNLQLARRIVGRPEIDRDEKGRFELGKSKSDSLILALKTPFDIPFLEFEVADALRRGGVEWSNDSDENLSKTQLKRFLKILKAARAEEGSRLKYVLLLDRPTAENKIDLLATVVPHLLKVDCESSFRGE